MSDVEWIDVRMRVPDAWALVLGPLEYTLTTGPMQAEREKRQAQYGGVPAGGSPRRVRLACARALGLNVDHNDGA